MKINSYVLTINLKSVSKLKKCHLINYGLIMNLSRYKFQAFTNFGFESLLRKELKQLKIKNKFTNIFGRKGIEFRASLPEIIRLTKQTKYLNQLNLELSHPFQTENEKMIRKNLKKVNFNSIIPR